MSDRAQSTLALLVVLSVAALPVAASNALDLEVAGEIRFTTNDGYINVGSGALGIRSEDQIVLAFDTNGDTSGSTKTDGLYIRDGASDRMYIRQDGWVGINTLTPGQRLDVAGNVRVSAQDGMVEGSSGNFRLHSEDGLILKMDANNDATGGEGIYFRKGNNADLMTITEGGRVGIGVASPEAPLHVHGDVKVTGNIAAKYQDVAEWVDAVEPLSPGTVVVVAPDAVNGVARSREAYAQSVIGVISAQPGVVLGEAGEGRVLVAQSGRVRVKVDASLGAIKQGDLLVSSATHGYAMKSQPVNAGGVHIHRPGTILGKALEPLSAGKGQILVLLTLQ